MSVVVTVVTVMVVMVTVVVKTEAALVTGAL